MKHDHGGTGLDLAALLAAVENASPVAVADVVGERLAQAVGASEVAFLIADFRGRALVRLGHTAGEARTFRQGRETAERVPLSGGPHGRALASQSVQVQERAGGTSVIAPVTNRGEAIGVLEVRLPGPANARAVTDVELAPHALAYVMIANRRFTDLFDWGQRSVAAEVQHRLLPGSYTCEAGQLALAAW